MSDIEKIENLLQKHVGENKSIIEIKTENLVAPGENFLGELFKLEIVARDEEKGTEKKYHAVAKKLPKPNDVTKKSFIQQIFQAEVNFYEKIVPALQNFQLENGVQNVMDCFAKLYGVRKNLDETSDNVDENAVIILENLHISGFANLDRHIGYDLESAELLVHDLAALHAVPLAMKLKEPELFENHVRRHCITSFEFENEKDKKDLDANKFFLPFIQDLLWESDKCTPFISKVTKILQNQVFPGKPEVREPFATFTHGDLWVNNAMIKIKNGTSIANKFVDFQFYTYRSPASDLLFFLFTSVQQNVLQENLDTLINYYHSQFIKNLTDLGCDTNSFIMSEFEKELALESKIELGHILMFLNMVVFAEKNKAPQVPREGDPRPDISSSLFRDEMRKNIHPKAKEKMWFLTETLGKRGWL